MIDDDPKNHGKAMCGWPVVGIEKPPKHAAVLISSLMQVGVMAERCHEADFQPIVLY